MQKHIAGAGACTQEGSPLPVVVLGAEQEVDEQHGDGGAGEDRDQVAEEEEAEHVVDLAEPDVVEDEEELDEDGAEGEDADKGHGGQGAQVGC